MAVPPAEEWLSLAANDETDPAIINAIADEVMWRPDSEHSDQVCQALVVHPAFTRYDHVGIKPWARDFASSITLPFALAEGATQPLLNAIYRSQVAQVFHDLASAQVWVPKEVRLWGGRVEFWDNAGFEKIVEKLAKAKASPYAEKNGRLAIYDADDELYGRTGTYASEFLRSYRKSWTHTVLWRDGNERMWKGPVSRAAIAWSAATGLIKYDRDFENFEMAALIPAQDILPLVALLEDVARRVAVLMAPEKYARTGRRVYRTHAHRLLFNV